jgi:peptidyl-tRNA hydrolase, PTH1 family
MNDLTTLDFQKIKLIVGLGNTGRDYESTRHNAGFLMMDMIASGKKFQLEKTLKSEIASVNKGKTKTYLAKPTTMMNSSGESVKLITKYFRIKPEEVLVVHDDLDISLGDFKIQFGKGPKIHNGVLSIENYLGTKDFWRCRIGIENRDPEVRKFIAGSDYVLERFKVQEQAVLDKVFQEILMNF